MRQNMQVSSIWPCKLFQRPNASCTLLHMIIDAVLRAAGILRSQPGYTMPLARLHAQLVSELGPDAAGSYGQIYQQLRKRGDSFLLFDTPRFLGSAENWPGRVREAYEEALDQAGLGSCVRVTLTEVPPSAETAELITALNSTMSLLANSCVGDEALEEYVELGTQHVAALTRALSLAEIARPTTLPPDPPPEE